MVIYLEEMKDHIHYTRIPKTMYDSKVQQQEKEIMQLVIGNEQKIYEEILKDLEGVQLQVDQLK